MAGFTVAFTRRKKFSIIGFLIQLVEALNILITKHKFEWVPFYHVMIRDDKTRIWYNADFPSVHTMSDVEFIYVYNAIEMKKFRYVVPPEALSWLRSQIGSHYSIGGIVAIYFKLIKSWMNRDYRKYVSGDRTFICTEYVLKFMDKCGFDVDRAELEVTTVYESFLTIKEL